MKKLSIFIAISFFFMLLSSLYILSNFPKKEEESVKAVSTSVILSPAPELTLTPSPTPIIFPKKSSYSIAIFGDSMVDTMGENLEYLRDTLTNKYPQTAFNLYNYGIGGQNVELGLARFESPFTNRERQYPPLPVLNPDTLIIGSFAYNTFSTHDRNKHYTVLKELISKAKALSSEVYLMAEIAPLRTGFGKGKNGVNMPENTAHEHALHIIEQLDNAVNRSVSEKIPLINVYYESRIDGKFGDPYYVNPGDGIHPSVAGYSLTAEAIVLKIKLD